VRLSETLTTPFDREDLFRLSRSIDDVLDNLRDFVREADLMGVADERDCATLIDAIVEALEHLKTAIAHVLDEPHRAPERALGAKKGGNHVRQLYQVAIASLFTEELSVDMLKRRELLRRLDVGGPPAGGRTPRCTSLRRSTCTCPPSSTLPSPRWSTSGARRRSGNRG
jgi:uncharacterized protein